MTLRNILVHVNVSKHCPGRVQIAAKLAHEYGAGLTGVFTSAASDVPYYMMEEIDSNAEPTMRAWWLRARDRVKAEFDRAMREAHLAAAWIEIDERDDGGVAREARYSDLTILGQIDREELLPRPEYRIPERVTLEAGGPVLVVPHAGKFATVGRRVLIAWNDTPQSARAVRDALPFLAKASTVSVLAVGSSGSGTAGRLAARLEARGIAAGVQELVASPEAVGDVILSRAADEAADMIVMGAYGHSRASEVILGGVTRTLFRSMTVPTLMSH